MIVYSTTQAPFSASNPGADCTQVALQRAVTLRAGAKVYGPAGQLLGTAPFTKGHYDELTGVGNSQYTACELTAALPNFLAEIGYKVSIANGGMAFSSVELAAAKWQVTFQFNYGTNQLAIAPKQPK